MTTINYARIEEMRAERDAARRWLSTGIPNLDFAISGGLVEGSLSLFDGELGIVPLLLGGAQAQGKVAMFMDVDEAVGNCNLHHIIEDLDATRLLVSQPSGLDTAVEILSAVMASGAVDLIVVRSPDHLCWGDVIKPLLTAAARGNAALVISRNGMARGLINRYAVTSVHVLPTYGHLTCIIMKQKYEPRFGAYPVRRWTGAPADPADELTIKHEDGTTEDMAMSALLSNDAFTKGLRVEVARLHPGHKAPAYISQPTRRELMATPGLPNRVFAYEPICSTTTITRKP